MASSQNATVTDSDRPAPPSTSTSRRRNCSSRSPAADRVGVRGQYASARIRPHDARHLLHQIDLAGGVPRSPRGHAANRRRRRCSRAVSATVSICCVGVGSPDHLLQPRGPKRQHRRLGQLAVDVDRARHQGRTGKLHHQLGGKRQCPRRAGAGRGPSPTGSSPRCEAPGVPTTTGSRTHRSWRTPSAPWWSRR